VLWGTPLPELVEDPPAPARTAPRPPQGRPRHARDSTLAGPPPWSPGPDSPPRPRRSPSSAPSGPGDGPDRPGPEWSGPPSGPAPAVRPEWSGPRSGPAPAVRPEWAGQPSSLPPAVRPDWSGPSTGPAPAVRPKWAGQPSGPPPAVRPEWSGPPSGPIPVVPRGRSAPRSGRAARAGADDTARRTAPAARRPPQRYARRGPRLVAVLTSLVLAAALAGAGVWWFALRETAVQPAVYVRSVCGSVRDWQQELDARTSTVTKSIAQQDDPVPIRAAVVAYYTALAGRTDTLHTALAGAGNPDLQGGKDYADALVRTVATEGAALRDSAARAARLDTSRKTVFQASLQSLLTNESTSVTAVITALAHPPAGTPPELRSTLAAEPACAPYTG